MDPSPPPVPPASSWHQSCMCWLRGIFWRLQEKWVALHATILCSSSPRQSFASPVCACASQTRLKQLTSVPPLLIPHLTSQTSEMFGIKEAQILRLVMLPLVIWMILPGIFNGTLMFVTCLYPVLYPNVNVIKIIWFFLRSMLCFSHVILHLKSFIFSKLPFKWHSAYLWIHIPQTMCWAKIKAINC